MRAAVLGLALLATQALAVDLEPRVKELERQVAELLAWRKAQEGQRPAVAAAREPGAGIIVVAIANKRFQAQDYSKGINNECLCWDTTYRLVGRDKPIRAVKGELVFSDLFGVSRLRIAWTVSEPFSKDRLLGERGKGILFDASNDNHAWLRAQKEADIRVAFAIRHILYEDGTSELFSAE